ncbi:hypothetical protein [Paraflavitalea sp. CAU 1676]|uniref:hypothetical protein n=1 Tax=Paraflavitalea sp. CAU 1676 TaxID=3032598 RepID=UPI0023DA18F9|nr:hypothetical protein [Paraflavitalea sp. CAU 1676]MDF2193448.1 hypothetical protein [Paraflavitalea sp. CAU 1676]
MKPLIYLTPLLFFSCAQPQTNDKTIPNADTAQKAQEVIIELPEKKTERTKYHTDKDTVYISSQAKETLKYSKEEFNDIVDNFPELTSMNTKNPDTAYYSKIWVDLVDSSGNKKHLTFDSEAGQDEYYILYAYFLKQKNGIAKYSARRKKLFEIYYTLNSLFGNLNHGGTYFGHQYSRIEGYAEFSLYWFRRYEDYFDRPYDITKQKQFYIAGLKQLIKDEVNIDPYINGEIEKIKRRNDLSKLVDDLNSEITDNFYLRMAQSFQSDYY